MAQSLSSAAESTPPLNSLARGELIRSAVKWIAEKKASVETINREIREYKTRVIRGDLGFKISDFEAVYRISTLELEDRNSLLECLSEGFKSLNLGGTLDWVSVQEAAERRRAGANGQAAPNAEARAAGRLDGLGGVTVNSDRWPQGVTGHSDYEMGVADGEAERDRINALGQSGNGHADGAAGEAAPRRGRGRPRKQPQEAEADAEL
jgi:hypothetical protein